MSTSSFRYGVLLSPSLFYFLFFFTDDLRTSSQVLRESLHITSEYFTQEAKVASLTSWMEALERENFELKKNLIVSMDETTSLKAKVKTLDDNLRVERKLTLEKDE